jgi:hypothetical protein
MIAQASRLMSAEAHCREGRWESALAESRACLDGMAPAGRRRAGAIAARAALECRQIETAWTALEQALASSHAGSDSYGEVDLQVVRAEILLARGNREDALAALRDVRGRILAMATGFTDAAIRIAFLKLEPNVRALELAKEWLGEDGP